jgi:hypothetical protein
MKDRLGFFNGSMKKKEMICPTFFDPEQGCQIFVGAYYQNRKNPPN